MNTQSLNIVTVLKYSLFLFCPSPHTNNSLVPSGASAEIPKRRRAGGLVSLTPHPPQRGQVPVHRFLNQMLFKLVSCLNIILPWSCKNNIHIWESIAQGMFQMYDVIWLDISLFNKYICMLFDPRAF